MTLPDGLSRPVDLAGRRIFITGGTGFVGRSLLDYLVEVAKAYGPKFGAVLLSRDPSGFLRRYPAYTGHGWLHFATGDVERLDAAFTSRAGRFTDVIHAAADARSAASPVAWMQQIVQGTQRSLEFSVASGARRYLLASSGAIYGPHPTDMQRMREDHTGAPSPQAAASAYGQAKRLAEQLCTAFRQQYGLETIVARYFALVGPHVPLNGAYAIGNFIRDALGGKPIRIAGDGSAVRSYLYGRDCAHWTFSLLLKGEPGQAYNVGADQGLSIAELARRVAACLSPASPIHIDGDAAQDGAHSVYVPDISRATGLGLRVETPLDLAIRLSAAAQLTSR